MKRASLSRRTPLRQTASLQRSSSLKRATAPLRASGGLKRGNGPRRSVSAQVAARASEAGYAEWHAKHYGRCAACGRSGRLVRHHVVLEQHVRHPPTGGPAGDPWDQRNVLELGAHCDCHELHHHGGDSRLSRSIVPSVAVAFAVELLGDFAGDYLSRRYRSS